MINLIEQSFRPDAGPVPADLFHGTSLERFLAIRASDVLREDAEARGNRGFSTTAEVEIAMKFARMSARARWGVVLTLDGAALAERYTVRRYDDDDDYETNEEEWIITADTGLIAPASRYIRAVRLLDTRRAPANQGWTEVAAHLLAWNGQTLPL